MACLTVKPKQKSLKTYKNQQQTKPIYAKEFKPKSYW